MGLFWRPENGRETGGPKGEAPLLGFTLWSAGFAAAFRPQKLALGRARGQSQGRGLCVAGAAGGPERREQVRRRARSESPEQGNLEGAAKDGKLGVHVPWARCGRPASARGPRGRGDPRKLAGVCRSRMLCRCSVGARGGLALRAGGPAACRPGASVCRCGAGDVLSRRAGVALAVVLSRRARMTLAEGLSCSAGGALALVVSCRCGPGDGPVASCRRRDGGGPVASCRRGSPGCGPVAVCMRGCGGGVVASCKRSPGGGAVAPRRRTPGRGSIAS